MTPARVGSPRQSRFSSWSLRKRLLVVTIALFVLLTVAVTVTSIIVMRHVLLLRLEDQLRDFGSSVRSQIVAGAQLDVVDPRGTPGGVALLQIQGRTAVDAVITFDGPNEGLSPQQVARLAGGSPGPADPYTASLDVRGDYRAIEVQMDHVDPDVRLYVALPMAEMNQTMVMLTMVIATSAIAAGTLLVALADVTIRRAMRPLTSVVATTERISQLPLDSGDVQMSNRVRIDDPATEVGRVGESVNRMLNHIESSLAVRAASENRMRQFVADASHELRTPLAAVKGYAEITRRHEQGMSDDAQTSLHRIEGAADRMSALVNDLLLLARLDEGREVAFAEVDLSKLVVEAAADAQAAGPAHPISLELPEDPVCVQGDMLRLQQVFANLLANARVHTAEGTGIDVSLNVHGEDVVVAIADHGAGIPAELKEKLFARFVRGDASRSRAAGSSGLGLAIAKAIVEAHGGRISVANREVGTGAVFTVRLPVSAFEDAAPA